MAERDRECFDAELGKWVKEGWLVPYDPLVHGEVTGVVPLMAAAQPNKPTKVRPVMDYREVNQYISSHPGMDVTVCSERLREWRRLGASVALLDLKKAYLQLQVSGDLVRFQAVRLKGKLHVMTRMGFGLAVAPKIMAKVLEKVLSLDENGDTPMQIVYSHEVQPPDTCAPAAERSSGQNPYKVGDAAYVKPHPNSCVSLWKKGQVTAVTSDVAVKVNGMPRHIADVRLAERRLSSNQEPCEEQHDADVVEDGGDTDESNLEPEEDGVQDEQAPASLRRSTRLRQPPQRYGLAYTH